METRDIFEQMAERYDTPERVANAAIIAQALRAALGETQGKRALDYGCGTGLVGLALCDVFGSMLLVDTSAQMVQVVARKIANAGIKNAEVLCADFCSELPVGLQADTIILSQVLLHVKDYPLLLKRLFSLLSSAGRLFIVDFDKNPAIVSDLVHNGFEQAELITQLLAMGFSSATARTFHHGEKMFMKQDASLFLLEATR